MTSVSSLVFDLAKSFFISDSYLLRVSKRLQWLDGNKLKNLSKIAYSIRLLGTNSVTGLKYVNVFLNASLIAM